MNMKEQTPTPQPQPTITDTRFGIQDVYRALASLAALTILVLKSNNTLDMSVIAVCIAIASYALISQVILKFSKPEYREKAYHASGVLDFLLMGLFLAYIDFSLLPASLLALMSLHCSLGSGGLLRGLEAVVALVTGAGTLALQKNLSLDSELSVNYGLVAAIAFGLYLFISSLYSYGSSQFLRQQIQSLSQQMLQLKLRTYKLSKYLSPALRKEILSGKEVKLETQRKKLTIFFSDIKGFSELAEEMEAEALTALLNNYLTEMSDIALKFGATIDKFIGDAMMVFFGDPNSRGAKTDCVACVSMAIAMKKHMKALQLRWANQGIQKPLEIRMGINTGYCTVGNFGTENRLDYTLLGTEVNLASRMESAAQPGEILISHECYSLVKDVIVCEDKGEINVKGYQHPIKVYSALDMRKNLGKDQTYFEHATDGFSVYMDLDKINNYDKDRILKSLKQAAVRLEKQKI